MGTIYITKEVTVEVEIDEEALGAVFEDPETSELLVLAQSLEMLHDEYHSGPLQVCFHPACHIAQKGLRVARDLAKRYGREDPSIAALHADAARYREARDRGRR